MSLDNDHSPILAPCEQVAHSSLTPSGFSLSFPIPRLVPSSFSTSEPRAALAFSSIGRASAALPCATRAARTPRIVVLLNDSVSFSSSRRSALWLSLVRRAGRSCCASLARSPARAARRSLVLRVRYVKHTLPSTGAFSSLIQALSTISLGHDRFHYARSLALSLSLARASCVSRLLSPTLTPFLRLLLTRRLLFLSYTRARGSPTASLLLFRVSFSFVCVIPL